MIPMPRDGTGATVSSVMPIPTAQEPLLDNVGISLVLLFLAFGVALGVITWLLDRR